MKADLENCIKTKKMFAKKKIFIAPVLYMGFIFLLSSLPDTSRRIFISELILNMLHTPLYGVLAFLWMRTFYYSGLSRKRAVLYTLIITILYTLTDEYHQSFVPGRDASLTDVMFDTIGCFAGALIYNYKNSGRKRR